MTRTVQNDSFGNARQPLGLEPLLRNLAISDVSGLGSLREEDPSFVHAFLARQQYYLDALSERDVTPGFAGLAARVEDQPFVPMDVFPAHAEDLARAKTRIQHDQQDRSKRLPAHTRPPAFPANSRARCNRQQPLLHPWLDQL